MQDFRPPQDIHLRQLETAGERTLRLPRPLLWTLALLFAAINVFYAFVWMVVIRSPHGDPPVELGFEADYLPDFRALKIKSVVSNSPAQTAGMKVGDRIVAIEGAPLADEGYQSRVWFRHKAGDHIRLTIQRPGTPAPFAITGTFRKNAAAPSLSERVALQLRGSFPVPFLLVGLTVLFLRVDDVFVWLLALMFAGFAAAPDIPNVPFPGPAELRPFILAYKTFAFGFLGPIFYCFFALFPERSPIERRVPWLKWVAIGMTTFYLLPPYRDGVPRLPQSIQALGHALSTRLSAGFIFGWVLLGLISLALNYVHTRDSEARRKLRIMFWGTLVGVVPIAVEQMLENFTGMSVHRLVLTGLILLAFLFPLSFAYAVVKHRVLEIPVLLKRSARYLLVQRGFTFLLSGASIAATLVFASWLNSFIGSSAQASQASGVAIGAVFGTALLWGGAQIHRKVIGRIDRAFFRGAYDARRILEDLSIEIRSVTDPAQLGELLDRQICHALHPRRLAIFLRQKDGNLHATMSDWPQLKAVPANVADARVLLAPLHPEYLAPMLGRNDVLVGLIVMGERLSEEPYSEEDKRLVGSAASQAATALDNFRLADEIAERLEAERRRAREMEIASDVQARLLPQKPPQLRTLSCAARCIQARSVGGDYFDFLQLDGSRVGLVLADVSGKGVHAALLVANLQAYLRSQSGAGVHDPAQALRVVNRMLWNTTAAQHYATLFYGVYDDNTRKLVYVNCGHNPPFLLRRSGSIERLEATALVIGLFEKWDASVAEVQLGPGDLLVIYSDGVTEAARGEEEFGEVRLVELLERNQRKPVDDIVSTVLGATQEFCFGVMADDMTLLVARGQE